MDTNNVWMTKPCSNVSFSQETTSQLRRYDRFGPLYLESDGAIVTEVVGAIDRRHPTLADGLSDLVAGQGEGGGHAANRRMMAPAGSTL